MRKRPEPGSWQRKKPGLAVILSFGVKIKTINPILPKISETDTDILLKLACIALADRW